MQTKSPALESAARKAQIRMWPGDQAAGPKALKAFAIESKLIFQARSDRRFLRRLSRNPRSLSRRVATSKPPRCCPSLCLKRIGCRRSSYAAASSLQDGLSEEQELAVTATDQHLRSVYSTSAQTALDFIEALIMSSSSILNASMLSPMVMKCSAVADSLVQLPVGDLLVLMCLTGMRYPGHIQSWAVCTGLMQSPEAARLESSLPVLPTSSWREACLRMRSWPSHSHARPPGSCSYA